MNKRANSSFSILYVSHGGGPLPLLGDMGHKELVANLRHIAALIARPAAIIVISAHWEAARPTITAGSNPPRSYTITTGFQSNLTKFNTPPRVNLL